GGVPTTSWPVGPTLTNDRYFFRPARAWRDNARCDAALRPSRFRAFKEARDRFGDALRPDFALARSRFACARVRAEAVPFFGGLSFTPARLAFERPMAM